MLERPRSTDDASPDPSDPIAAVTHRDPYPYYARLVAERPLYRDDALGLWVASGAPAVAAVLDSELCRVRPPGELVPKALQGTPSADVFGRFVRMNDGGRHGPMKQAVSAALGSIGEQAAAASRDWARFLVAEPLQDFSFRLPVYVMASLLGFGRDLLEPVARWIGDMAAGFAPGVSPEKVESAGVASAELRGVLRDLAGASNGNLLANLAREARRAGC